MYPKEHIKSMSRKNQLIAVMKAWNVPSFSSIKSRRDTDEATIVEA